MNRDKMGRKMSNRGFYRSHFIVLEKISLLNRVFKSLNTISSKRKSVALFSFTLLFILTLSRAPLHSQTKDSLNLQQDTLNLQQDSLLLQLDDTTSKKSLFFKPKQHMIGVRAGVNLSNLATTPDLEYKNIKTYNNFSFLYTYYHHLWSEIMIFGLQVGLSHLEQGYLSPEGEVRYNSTIVPLVSQFHFDFWRMRLLVNGGCFIGQRSEMLRWDGTSFDEYDIKRDFGYVVGGGVAYILRPFELHLEGNYHHSLNYLHKPERPGGVLKRLFGYPNQLVISLALHFRF